MIDAIKKTLWAAADKLCTNMDAGEYKHFVLRLNVLKYVSEALVTPRAELRRRFTDESGVYFLHSGYDEFLAADSEALDNTLDFHVFCMPEDLRCEAVRASAKHRNIGKRTYDFRTLIDPTKTILKGLLDKRYGSSHLPDNRLGELEDFISTIGIGDDAGEGTA